MDLEVRTSGQTVVATPTDRIVVCLAENATTGYQWVLAAAEEPLRLESDELLPPEGTRPGADGERVIILSPIRLGRARVSLVLKRAWESEPIDQFDCQVIIEDR